MRPLNNSSTGRLLIRHGESYPKPDELGFTIASNELLRLEELCGFRCAFIRGHQWIGKSYVAIQLEAMLRENLSGGNHVMRLDLECWMPGSHVLPSGWQKWKESERNGTVIIDSLDEGELICTNVSHEIARLLRELTSSELRRLNVYMFCRANEVPEKFPAILNEIFGDEFADVELLPMDQQAAKTLLGSSEFERVKVLIQANRLTQVSGFPAVLETLRLVRSEEAVTKADIWKRILVELMTERRGSRHTRGLPVLEQEKLFSAAAHIAAAMLLSGVEQIGRDVEITNLPKITAFSCGTHPHFAPDHLSQALHCPLFHNGRFVKRNVQEWLASFGMSRLSLEQFRPLVSLTAPGKFGQLTGVMALLCLTSEHKAVRDWIIESSGGIPPASDAPFSLAEALTILDGLESIADSTSLQISHWRDKGLERLDIPGFVPRVAERLRDRSRSINVRTLLIELCELNTEEGPPAVAFEILMTPDEVIPLKHKAMSFHKEFTNEQVVKMGELVRRTLPNGDREKALFARIMIVLIERGLANADECVKYAPIPDGNTIDHTFILMDRIKEGLTPRGARVVLERLIRPWLRRRSKRLQSPRRSSTDNLVIHRAWKETAGKAFGLLFGERNPSKAFENLVVRLMFHPRKYDFDRDSGVSVLQLVRSNQQIRRRIYLEEVDRLRRGQDENGCRQFNWILAAEDWSWLRDQIRSLESTCDGVWEDLARLARWLKGKTKTELRRFIQARAPASLQRSDLMVRKHTQQERRHNEKLKKQEARSATLKESTQIAELVKDILSRQDAPPKARWFSLCNVCFRPTAFRAGNISGSWDDLDNSLRSEVDSQCWDGLLKFNPTSLPEDRSLPSTVLAEAWCFSHFVTAFPERIESNSTLIARWLPSVFIFPMDDRRLVLDCCNGIDRDAVRKSLARVVRRDLLINPEATVETQSIPTEYWTDELIASVMPLISDTLLQPKGRAELLKTICQNRPGEIGRLSALFLQSSEPDVRFEAIHWLAYTEPERFVSLLKAESATSKDVLHSVARFSSFNRSGPTIHEWSSELLTDLYSILRTAFPKSPEVDTDEGGIVHTIDEITDFYDSIPGVLAARVDERNTDSISRIQLDFPDLRPIFEYEATQSALSASVVEGRMNVLPLPDVVRVLSNPNYRIIRHNDDLLHVLVETLERIKSDAATHIEMLYLPDEISDGPKHRHESALQSYIACRLQDILPERVIRREVQVTFRQRNDIEVTAESVTGNLCTVIIEVKWSDNADKKTNASNGLSNQLGDIYLRENKKTHGIFVVGWNGRLGTWRCRSTAKPNEMTPRALEQRLDEQATLYQATHHDIRIRAIVFDLQWPTRLHKRQRERQRG